MTLTETSCALSLGQPSRLAQMLIARSPAVILDRVSARFVCTRDELIGRDRHSHVAHARQVAAWLLRRSGWSYVEIGRALGGRHHTTIMYAIEKIERERAASEDVRRALDEMLNNDEGRNRTT